MTLVRRKRLPWAAAEKYSCLQMIQMHLGLFGLQQAKRTQLKANLGGRSAKPAGFRQSLHKHLKAQVQPRFQAFIHRAHSTCRETNSTLLVAFCASFCAHCFLNAASGQAHFVAAAGVGDIQVVAEFLDDEWDLNCKFHDKYSPVSLDGDSGVHPPQGQTALIKVLQRARELSVICAALDERVCRL